MAIKETSTFRLDNGGDAELHIEYVEGAKELELSLIDKKDAPTTMSIVLALDETKSVMQSLQKTIDRFPADA